MIVMELPKENVRSVARHSLLHHNTFIKRTKKFIVRGLATITEMMSVV